MNSTRRTFGIVALTLAAVVLGEMLLQIPLYRWLQPEILTPAEGAVVSPPLVVQWDGPPRMALSLLGESGKPRDLGVHASGFALRAADLPAPGAYRLQARATLPVVGGLIQTERRFAVAPMTSPASAASPAQSADPRVNTLAASLESLKAAQEQTQTENSVLYEENASLRQENALITQELDKATMAHDEAMVRAVTRREHELDLAEQNRALTEELTAMQWQLNAALTCTVWGYYAYPHPQTIPPTRRVVTVSDIHGEVFRNEANCELVRETDPTSASRCFCVGTPWGG